MRNLLCANMFRLRASMTFWLIVAAMTILGIAMAWTRWNDTAGTGSSDNLFLACAGLIGLCQAVFCAWFLGVQRGERTMVNMVSVGRTRGAIYAANLLTAMLAGIVMCVAYFVTYFGGYMLLAVLNGGQWTSVGGGMTAAGLALLVVSTLTLSLVYGALFTAVGMLCRTRALAAIVAMLIALVLLFVGFSTLDMLSQPPTVLVMDNSTDGGSWVANPDYLEGDARVAVQLLTDLNPGGQSLQLNVGLGANLSLLPLYDLAVTALACGGGYVLFHRKDLQ